MPAAARPDPNRDPIGPFLHYLMAECGLSPNTLAAYRSDIVRFSRWRKQHAPGPLAELDIGTLDGLRRSPRPVAAWPPSSIGRNLAAPLDVLSVPDLRRPAPGERGQAPGRPGGLGPPADGPRPVGRRPAPVGPRPRDRPSAVATARRWRPSTRPAAGPRRSSASGRPTSTWTAARPDASARGTRSGSSRSGSRAREALDRIPDARPARPARGPAGDVPNVFVTRSGPAAVAGRALEDRQDARPGRRAAARRSARTRSGTASPPTSSPAAPTSGSSRRCSATPRSPRPRSTPGSSSAGSARSTPSSTPGRRRKT